MPDNLLDKFHLAPPILMKITLEWSVNTWRRLQMVEVWSTLLFQMFFFWKMLRSVGHKDINMIIKTFLGSQAWVGSHIHACVTQKVLTFSCLYLCGQSIFWKYKKWRCWPGTLSNSPWNHLQNNSKLILISINRPRHLSIKPLKDVMFL